MEKSIFNLRHVENDLKNNDSGRNNFSMRQNFVKKIRVSLAVLCVSKGPGLVSHRIDSKGKWDYFSKQLKFIQKRDLFVVCENLKCI